MQLSIARMNIQPSEFWKLTFAEWRPMYETIFGKASRPMTIKDSKDLIAQYQKQFEDKDGKP